MLRDCTLQSWLESSRDTNNFQDKTNSLCWSHLSSTLVCCNENLNDFSEKPDANLDKNDTNKQTENN